MNNLVRQKLREIVQTHGTQPLSDARLCENLLKDYCGEYKKEIFLLVCAVREQVAADLLVSKGSMPPAVLRKLLIKRLQNNLALTEEASRWAVESWSHALVGPLAEASHAVSSQGEELDEASLSSSASSGHIAFPHSTPKFEGGVLARCDGAVRSVAVSPDGERIVFGGDDARIRLWNFETGRMEIVGQCDGAVSSVSFSPDGACVASASDENTHGSSPIISIWEVQSGEMTELGGCSGRLPVIAYSPGGKSLAAASNDTERSLQLWNLHTGHRRVFKSEASGLLSLSFSPDGRVVATGDGQLSHGAIRLWELDSGALRILGYCSRRITSVAFSPDGKYLASGSWDETVQLWNVQTGQTRILGKNCSCINVVAYAPDGKHLAACSLDGRIRIWDVQTERSRSVGVCHGINSAIFNTDSRSLITGSLDGMIRLWPL
jgi:WD40 repeat protein